MNDQPSSAPQRGTGLAFVQQWEWVAEKGLMPKATARAYRAAVSQILKIDEGWEDREVQGLDVDALVARFRNLSRLSPSGLRTYESRFRSALSSYLRYLQNPGAYQPRGRGNPPRVDRARRGVKEEPAGEPGEAVRLPPTPPAQVTRPVVYPFPVRPEVFAERKLPPDLTLDEAGRLGRFLEAVALSDPGGDGE